MGNGVSPRSHYALRNSSAFLSVSHGNVNPEAMNEDARSGQENLGLVGRWDRSAARISEGQNENHMEHSVIVRPGHAASLRRPVDSR